MSDEQKLELRKAYIQSYRRKHGGVAPNQDQINSAMDKFEKMVPPVPNDLTLIKSKIKKEKKFTDIVHNKIKEATGRIENLETKKVMPTDTFLARLNRAKVTLGFDSPMMGEIVEVKQLADRMNMLADHWMTDLYMISESEFLDMFNIARLTLHGLETKLSSFMASLQNS